jgi:TolA-binding protein
VARINNLTKAINLDYRNFVPRDKLRTGEAEHHAAVEQLSQQNAMANYESKSYGQAARGLQAAVDRNPNNAQAHYNLGRVLWAQGKEKNAQRALDEFGAAIQLDPKMAAPWRDAGVVFYEMRDVNKAAQAFDRYLQLAPDAPEAPQIRAFLNVVKNQ